MRRHLFKHPLWSVFLPSYTLHITKIILSDWCCSSERDSNMGLSRIVVFKDCKATALTSQPPGLVIFSNYFWQNYWSKNVKLKIWSEVDFLHFLLIFASSLIDNGSGFNLTDMFGATDCINGSILPKEVLGSDLTNYTVLINVHQKHGPDHKLAPVTTGPILLFPFYSCKNSCKIWLSKTGSV